MRKRSRLVNKIVICMCAVLCAVSAFFYAPIESFASGVISQVTANGSSSFLVTKDFSFSVGPKNSNSTYFEVDIGVPASDWVGSPFTASGNVMSVDMNYTFVPSVSIVSNQSSSGYSISATSYEFHFGDQYCSLNPSNYLHCTFDTSLYKNKAVYSLFFVRVKGVISCYEPDAQEGHITARFTLGLPEGKYMRFSFYDFGLSSSEDIKNQTDDLTNGFDSSQGDSVNSDLSAGLNEFQTAEDSLFTTASSGLDDFSFFNFASIPAMVTGMSFVSSIMTSWFNQAGGASGVGIVLSILFSIMLVAMVLGLYRWYQSKGGKD